MAININNEQQFYIKKNKIAPQKDALLGAIFELTYRCNFNCVHCYIPRSYRKESERKELKTKKVFSILDMLKDFGHSRIIFTGGEIFMRKDIMEILWYAKRKGFKFSLNTNASLIDGKIAEELRYLKPNRVEITIHAINRDSFKKTTRAFPLYDRVFKAIGFLRNRKISLSFKTVVIKENKADIVEINRFSKSFNIGYRIDDELEPGLDGSIEPYRHFINRRDFEKIAKKCGFITQGKNGKEMFCNACGCGMYDNILIINPFGKIRPCFMIINPHYNILNGLLKEKHQLINNFAEHQVISNRRASCAGCEFWEYCRGCAARAYFDTGSFTACDSIARTRAIEKKRLAEINTSCKLQAPGHRPETRGL